ncbi:hypothetical protein Nepgr_008821 [Nepenthes gracilis]|uniref:Mitogen-activated protein kinase kinase kinase 1 n=1 Tax=Nepenthes gracilis TaxID=150966 RepID=A0AAD3SAA5_NEPGR|nr:hypothetical protein Nepgr_008821 [Nepenthes gracilis]
MESVASNSTPAHDHHHNRKPAQAFMGRINRAFSHRLRLLHRSDSNFFILGATGNVYTVTLTATPSCTCPDRTTPCKHILFTLIRVLGTPPDDACLRRRTLRPCQLNRLLGAPTSHEALANVSLRERFHRLFFHARQGSLRSTIEVDDGAACPVCLDEMGREEKVVACGTCRNPIHEDCLMNWKKSQGRRSASCVICRARWRDKANQEKYLNLAAYIQEEDDVPEIGVNEGGVCGD